MNYGQTCPVETGAEIKGRDNVQSAFVKAADLIKMVQESRVAINAVLERTMGPVPETPSTPHPENKQVLVSRPGQLGELHDALDHLTREVRDLRVFVARLEGI